MTVRTLFGSVDSRDLTCAMLVITSSGPAMKRNEQDRVECCVLYLSVSKKMQSPSKAIG